MSEEPISRNSGTAYVKTGALIEEYSVMNECNKTSNFKKLSQKEKRLNIKRNTKLI